MLSVMKHKYMKLVLSILIAFFYFSSIYGQNDMYLLDQIISDTTIIERKLYVSSANYPKPRLTNIVKIDRKNRLITDNDLGGDGSISFLNKYDANWNIKEELTYFDSLKISHHLYSYDSNGNCIKTEYFRSYENEEYKIMRPSHIIEHQYNSEGRKVQNNYKFYKNQDTLEWTKSKMEIFYNRKGKIKQRKYYETKSNSEDYKIHSETKIKYLLFNKNRTKKIIYFYTTGKKSFTELDLIYESGKLFMRKENRNNIYIYIRKYFYENNLLKEERIKAFGPQINDIDYKLIFEYIKN